MKIGILDWGIGGCGLVSKLENVNADLVYLSDEGYEPYGKVQEEALKQRVEKCLDFLYSQKVDMIAVACNAASTMLKANNTTLLVSDYAQKIIKQIPEEASIGVIGGYRLVESNMLGTASFPKHQIRQAVAQKMSAHIEAGRSHENQAYNDLKEILDSIQPIEHLILACTHYISMQKDMLNLYPSLQIHDPVVLMANEIHSRIDFPIEEPKKQWYTTGSKEGMVKAAKLAFNVHISHVDQIKL